MLGMLKTLSQLCCRLCLCCAGLSKFAGGMLGAAFSPRLMLAAGLMATSVINITFGFTTGVFWWTALWAMNGALQVRSARPLHARHITAACQPYVANKRSNSSSMADHVTMLHLGCCCANLALVKVQEE